MNYIYINKADENLIVDRFIQEWCSYNSDYVTDNIEDADIVWIIAPWNLSSISTKILKEKKIICTIHHIDIDKFKGSEKREFYKLDQYVDIYHVISKKTSKTLQNLTSKSITYIPFWINQDTFYQINDKTKLREKYGIPIESYSIGSFQRDTEKKGYKRPKLSKGPDQYLEIAKHLNTTVKRLHVVLAGKRREYIISRLKKENINYSYFEMVDFSSLNDLYNILDLYIVASRVEGGPAAVLESAVSKTPIIATDVGIVSEILNPVSIFNMSNFKTAKPDVDFAYENSKKYQIPKGFDEFNTFFQSL
jgi:glycosyltransferase involved in cell wall biosynthesis